MNLKLSNFIFKEKQLNEIFNVRGFQRSGTNWVGNLLNLHPLINCQGEYHFQHFYKSLTKYSARKFTHPDIELKLKKNITKTLDEIIIKQSSSTLLSGDRTPTSLISTYVPGRKNILITRDGRDCIVSWVYHCLRNGIVNNREMKIKQRLFNSDSSYFENNKNELLDSESFIKTLSRNWNHRIKQDQEAITKSENGEIDMPILHIKYEELAKETLGQRNLMYSFLNVDPKDASPLDNLTTSGFKNHNVKSHNRIGKPGRWQLYFTDKQLSWFDEISKEAMEILNLK